MTAYATVADVEGEFKNTAFTLTSAEKTAQVQAFIDQATAEINSKVGMIYVLPIVAADALLHLKSICVWIAAHRIKPLLKIETNADKGSVSVGEGELRRRADKALADIQNRTTDLTILGAVLKSTGEGADSHNSRAGVTKKFKKDDDQW